jgi:hypothetical protein
MPDALWEKLATYGALGLVVAWLLLERWLNAKADRHARHALANAITANNLAISTLCTKMEDLSRSIWQFILTGGGKRYESREKDSGRNG